MRKLIVMAAFAALLVGCQKNVEEVELSPLEKLKEHISEVDGKRGSTFDREWTSISYDVRKTDSLVSPYTATISTVVYDYNRHTDKDPIGRYDYRINLAYQNDKWVVKQVFMNDVGMPGEEEFYADGEQELSADHVYYTMVSSELKLK